MESPVMAYAYDITPNYSYIFEFENEFIHTDYRKWMTENWTVAFYYVGVYMAFIFGGQYYMQNRPRYVTMSSVPSSVCQWPTHAN
ncbi:hypothetical protein HW555_007978 [Spodoptera exigua]|uniref:Very-long-chain 3-oxoacyl-CoA synthase n=1 Tax=Spodoptera exigua TaxID=7107 RepID=A0A835GF73_SPOEX|nr:hypothetical protein HW555_007978 [Spodoptera exigua]